MDVLLRANLKSNGAITVKQLLAAPTPQSPGLSFNQKQTVHQPFAPYVLRLSSTRVR